MHYYFNYTNFDFITYELKQTYIRQAVNETYNELKIRHSKYGNIGKLLIECVHVFGYEMSKKEQYMHNIENYQLFSTFSGEFYSAISVTNKLLISHLYNNDNEIILILGSDYCARYFDSSWISDESYENEKLFIAGQYLEIRSIIDIKYKRKLSILYGCNQNISNIN